MIEIILEGSSELTNLLLQILNEVNLRCFFINPRFIDPGLSLHIAMTLLATELVFLNHKQYHIIYYTLISCSM